MIIMSLGVGIGYLLCAFSPYFSPVEHPVLALAGLCIPFFIIANFGLLVCWLFMKRKFALIPVLFFLIGADALCTYMPFNVNKAANGGKIIKVLTYNTQGMMTQKDEAGKSKIPTLDYIKRSGADIVCLQEFPVKNQQIIKQLKKVYPYIRYVVTSNDVGVACLSKKPIQSVKSIKMVSENNGSAVFHIKDGEQLFPVIVNHLESNKLNDEDKAMYRGVLKDPKSKVVSTDSKYLIHKLADAVAIRAPQADKVAARIKELNDPFIIVCGDFNDSPISYAHNVIADGLQDAYVEGGKGPGITYNRNFLFFRIDHLLVGRSYRVLRTEVDRSIDASDHYPVWTLLEK